MKKRILGAMFALFATGLFFAQDDMPISRRDMPSAVQKNVTRYFGNKAVSYVTKDWEDGRVVYDVYFENDTEAEFRSNGNIVEVKSYNGVPSSVVPSKIQAYVRRYYPQNRIVHWEKEWNKQKVELDNDLDLEFTQKGDFLRIDN